MYIPSLKSLILKPHGPSHHDRIRILQLSCSFCGLSLPIKPMVDIILREAGNLFPISSSSTSTRPPRTKNQVVDDKVRGVSGGALHL